MEIEIKGNLGYYILILILCVGIAVLYGTPLDWAFVERLLTIEGLMFTFLAAGELADKLWEKIKDIAFGGCTDL